MATFTSSILEKQFEGQAKEAETIRFLKID